MNPYLLPPLEFGPLIIERLLEQVPASRLDEPTAPGRFSIREVVAHMADWEPILLERLKTANATSGATVEGFDEGQMAIDHNYAGSDIKEQIRLFIAARHATAEFLRSLQPEDWKKSIMHQERGPMTIEEQANMLLGHDLYHIEQISSLLPPKTTATW